MKCAIGNHRDHPLRDLNISVARKYEQLIQWCGNFEEIVKKHDEEMRSHESLVVEVDSKHNDLVQEVEVTINMLKSKRYDPYTLNIT